ncbi:TRAP transporter small permease [Ferrovibrio sp. MS7]|uniref:TRAP transporter small permease n=1 Tax=Ferrovibrio plantarum TaxID=3119164 RepID=UPI001B69E8E8|nr:TRAP transporter small permease [Ferrovibrio sp.]
MTSPSDQKPAPLDPPPVDNALRWEDWIGATSMGLLAIITMANVVARYFTDQSFAWTEEISTGLMVTLTLAAGAAAVARDRHIRIEFLLLSGSAARRKLLALLSSLCTAIAFGLLTGFGCRFAYDDYRFDVTSPGIGLPQWWFSIWLPLLALAVTLRAAQLFIKQWRQS